MTGVTLRGSPSLELIYDTSLLGSSKLNVAIRNSSNADLHNCTLVLCLNMTDMYPDDYHAYKVGETLPLVSARKDTSFESLKLDAEVFGEKTGDDIVAARGILIANEAVLWVDTDKYKIAERFVLKARTWYADYALTWKGSRRAWTCRTACVLRDGCPSLWRCGPGFIVQTSLSCPR